MRHYAVQSCPVKACPGMGAATVCPLNIALLFPLRLTQNESMENDPPGQSEKARPEKAQPEKKKDLLRWATTPPQSYVVYLVCLILVWMLSFYAGSLKPKNAQGLGPPPVMAPPR
jgi:hypothetical protein